MGNRSQPHSFIRKPCLKSVLDGDAHTDGCRFHIRMLHRAALVDVANDALLELFGVFIAQSRSRGVDLNLLVETQISVVVGVIGAVHNDLRALALTEGVFDGELARQRGTAGKCDLHQITGVELALSVAKLDMRTVLAERIPGTIFVALHPQPFAHGDLPLHHSGHDGRADSSTNLAHSRAPGEEIPLVGNCVLSLRVIHEFRLMANPPVKMGGCFCMLKPMALTSEQLADIRTRIPERPKTDIPMPYEDLVRKILTEGTLKSDRTGTGTVSLFGQQIRFDLNDGFPLLTTKNVFFKGLAYELLWFLKGSTNVRWLQEHNVHIWDEWADENGDLGPVYGAQWRSWPAPTPEDPNRTIDQIANVMNLIKNNPDSRRMVVSAWNPAEVENMALPPCHALFQFYVADGRLSCQLYQRSCDMFLGVPFNIASYSLLTLMMAQQAGLEPGEFVWTGGDCHVYDNHIDQVLEQLGREPYPYPRIRINKAESLFDYDYEDFEIVDYRHHPTIKAPVAV